MSEGRYVVISSKDSLHLYPWKTMSNFRVKLSRRLYMKGTWECACVRFSFTNSLCTFNRPQEVYMTETDLVGETEARLTDVLIAPQRFLSTEHLINVINETVKQEVSVGDNDVHPSLTLDKYDRVKRVFGRINDKKYHLELSPTLDLLLGLQRDGFHFLDAYKTDLYVYVDCIKSRIVGDVNAPLLTTIDIGNRRMVPGEQTIVNITKPEYTPVSNSEVDEIEVQILDDTGRTPAFDFGVVSLTLHFRES